MISAKRRRAAGLLAMLVLAACEGTLEPGPTPVIDVTPGMVELLAGQTVPLTAHVLHASNTAVLWRSLSPAIATVSSTGVVTAVAPGAAEIRALLAADTTVYGMAAVVVAPTSGPGRTLQVLGLGAVPERFTGEVAVRGEWAYTSTWSVRATATGAAPGNAIKIWDVSGAPVLRDSLIVPGATTTGDVQISDDGALLVVATEFTPGSIVIYDRSNPSRPQLRSQFMSDNTRPGVHTVKLGRVNNRHYAFLSVNPSMVARLVIVDITNPSAPTEVWAGVMGRPYVHDVFVRDGLLFAALWDDGMRIFDIGGGGRGGSPAAPVVMGNVLTPTGRIHNIWWFHDPTTGAKRYAFLGEEGPGGPAAGSSSGDVHVIDVSDLTNPRRVAMYNVPGAGTHNFSMDEQSGILYVAYYNGGVRAIDVRGDLSVCADAEKTNGVCNLRLMGREVGSALTTGAYVWGVAYQGNHVFASDMLAGLYKIDVSALRR